MDSTICFPLKKRFCFLPFFSCYFISNRNSSHKRRCGESSKIGQTKETNTTIRKLWIAFYVRKPWLQPFMEDFWLQASEFIEGNEILPYVLQYAIMQIFGKLFWVLPFTGLDLKSLTILGTSGALPCSNHWN